MPLLDEGMLADLRAINNDAMPDTCNVYSVQSTRNGIGEYVAGTPVLAVPGVACRVSLVKRQADGKRVAAGIEMLSIDAEAAISMPLGTSVYATDEIQTTSGTRWQVNLVRDTHGYSTSLVVEVKRKAVQP